MFDIGAIQYKYFPVFLSEVNDQESYNKIIGKIRQNPDARLTDEEVMAILYRPLFNNNQASIERDALLVIKDIQEMKDESEKARLTGTLFVLVKEVFR